MKYLLYSILILVFVSISAGSWAQTIVYVNNSATGANNGTSWVNAYTTIQPAINSVSASGGGEVWIKANTYLISTALQLPNGVSLYGGFSGNESLRSQRNWRNNVTRISGDIGVTGVNTDNASGLLFSNSSTLNSTIDGLHFTDVYTNGAAAVRIFQASITVQNCSFYDNTAYSTGTAPALQLLNGDGKVINCEFYNNTTITNNAGAVLLSSPSPKKSTVVNCKFYNNSANLSAGAINALGVVDIYNNVFYKNTANSGGAMTVGSGFYTIINNVFFDNVARTNSVNNIQHNSGSYSVSKNVYNGIFSYSGNFNIDPHFIDPDNGNFRMSCSSPAINIGDNSVLPSYITEDSDGNPRIFGSTIDIGPYEVQSPVLGFTAIETADLTCFESSNGQISLNAGGGIGALTYSVDGTNFSGNTLFTGLTAGIHTVYVKDSNGCTAQSDVTLTQPALLTISDITSTDITCNGSEDGTISFRPSGGTGLLTYTLNGNNVIPYATGETSTRTVDIAVGGNYVIGVKDINNCSAVSTSISINEPSALTLTAVFDGSQVNLTATGGEGSYEYQVDEGDFQSDSFFILANGLYTFTVRDINGCETTTVEAILVTALESGTLEKASIYPNPVVNNLMVTSSDDMYQIKIFDGSGKLIISRRIYSNKFQLNTSKLKQGPYILLLTKKDNTTELHRFIKN